MEEWVTMIPGEYLFDGPPLELNAGRDTCEVSVNNTSDRPVQIGSHYHFFEVNRALKFDRVAGYGMRLDLPAGTAARFEPGEVRTVRLVAMGGERILYGGSGLVNGALDDDAVRKRALERLEQWQRGALPDKKTRRQGDKETKKKRRKAKRRADRKR
jgi:urease beta subunit